MYACNPYSWTHVNVTPCSVVSFTNNTVYCVPSLEEKVWKPEIHDINNYYSKVELVPSNVHFFVSDPSKTAECTTVRLIQYQHFEYEIA